MAITISFTRPLNASLQIGDTAYHCSISALAENGEYNIVDGAPNYPDVGVEIGVVTAISPFNGTVATITCSTTSTNAPAAVGDFVFFTKDPIVNTGRLKGYYAKARIKKSQFLTPEGDPELPEQQKLLSELYSVSSEMYISSK